MFIVLIWYAFSIVLNSSWALDKAERNNQKPLLLAISKMLADKAPKRYANEIKNLNKNLGYGSSKEIVNDILNH